MSEFLSDLIVRALRPSELKERKSSRQVYELREDLHYDSDAYGSIVVPKGFFTDFASIPRVAFSYLDPEDPVIIRPSVVHDYLYSVRGILSAARQLTREDADLVLQEAMGISGARWGQKKVVFNAVRLFGSTHWKIAA